MPDAINFDDCCRMILDGWRFRRASTAPVLREYKQNLLMLLMKEFCIDWHDKWPEFPPNEGLPGVASTMPRDYARLNDPFAGYIEYSEIPGERKVLDRHLKKLGAAEAALKERWVALFRDLLLLRWPEAARRQTSWTRLKTLGLGEPVDEIDFFW